MLSTAEPGRSKGSSAGRALAPLRGAACGRVHHSAGEHAAAAVGTGVGNL